MRIIVLGANGMLGRYVHSCLTGSIGLTRKDINPLLTDRLPSQLDAIELEEDVVINCIGITNKRNCPDSDFYLVNSLFPRVLADYCEAHNTKLIHITTDCVFTGQQGNYNELSIKDERGIYGLSKSFGEPTNAIVVRTSIIGENERDSKDLLEWVRTHHNAVINGYTNHFWNGITCLQFAKICEAIIDTGFAVGSRHVFSPDAVSKFTLVSMINEIYGLSNVITERESHIYCDRTLSSIYRPIFDIPSIYDQIVEQKNYKL